jgi:C4-dicarboxylate transporter
LVPVAIGYFFFKGKRVQAILILLGGLVIDIDHFLASPVFDPHRCSIGFHPLHSYWAIALYTILLFVPKTRIIGLALMIHILADVTDCYYSYFLN